MTRVLAYLCPEIPHKEIVCLVSNTCTTHVALVWSSRFNDVFLQVTFLGEYCVQCVIMCSLDVCFMRATAYF